MLAGGTAARQPGNGGWWFVGGSYQYTMVAVSVAAGVKTRRGDGGEADKSPTNATFYLSNCLKSRR